MKKAFLILCFIIIAAIIIDVSYVFWYKKSREREIITELRLVYRLWKEDGSPDHPLIEHYVKDPRITSSDGTWKASGEDLDVLFQYSQGRAGTYGITTSGRILWRGKDRVSEINNL